jgi:hypothetical protein
LRKLAREFAVSERRKNDRKQCRNNPDRHQKKEGYCALPTVTACNPKQYWKKTQQDDHGTGTEPNSYRPPSRTKKPWHGGKAERQNNREGHQNAEIHILCPIGFFDSVPNPPEMPLGIGSLAIVDRLGSADA